MDREKAHCTGASSTDQREKKLGKVEELLRVCIHVQYINLVFVIIELLLVDRRQK